MNSYPPIEPIDEKIYNIRLKDGSIIVNVEYWGFGGGFLIKQKGMTRLEGYGNKYVDFKLEEITGFELV
jgi:hypothetical protein